MNEQRKTKAQLIEEMGLLRERISTLEQQAEITAPEGGQPGISAKPTLDNAAASLRPNGVDNFVKWATEQSPIPMLIATTDEKIWFVNQAFARRFGSKDGEDVKPGADLSGLSDFREYYDVEGNRLPVDELPLSLAIRGITSSNVDLRVVKDDGTQEWRNASAAPIYGEDGNLVGGLLMVLDTSNLKRELQQLQEEEERNRILVDHAPDSSYLMDPGGRIIDANAKACDSLGYTRKELKSLSVPDIDIDFPADKLSARLAGVGDGDRYMVEGQHRRKDGSTFPVEINLQVFASKGQLLTLALARDISERKHAEQILLESERTLREAQHIAHLGSWSGDWIYRMVG